MRGLIKTSSSGESCLEGGATFIWLFRRAEREVKNLSRKEEVTDSYKRPKEPLSERSLP